MIQVRRVAGDSDRERAAVVRIHITAFPGFFLTRIGPVFLDAYYREVSMHAGGIFLVAERGDQVVGFVAGFHEPELFYGALKRRWWRFAVPVVLGVVRQPSLLAAALGNVVRVFRAAGAVVPHGVVDHARACELASLAVDPAAGGSGVGAALVEAFCEHARQAGAASVLLTTDQRDNDPVIRFYERLGFTVARTFERSADRPMLEFVRSLVDDA